MRIGRDGLLPLVVVLSLVVVHQESSEREVPTAPSAVLYGAPAGYRLLEDPQVRELLRSESSVSALIGSDGGSLELLGHRIDVPSGAVSAPVRFTLSVLPRYVEVDVHATASGRLGRAVEVGTRRLAEPIPVTLSYARTAFASNSPGVEELTILRVPEVAGYGAYEPIPSTVDTVGRTVAAELDHFSRYTLAIPH